MSEFSQKKRLRSQPIAPPRSLTVDLAPPGTAIVFFTSSLPGLSTALGVLRDGFVIAGERAERNRGSCAEAPFRAAQPPMTRRCAPLSSSRPLGRLSL